MSSTTKTISPKEFIVFTSCSMVLTAIGIDIMLPAFADIRRHFGLAADTPETSKLVTYFFMGQITQVVFGYLTDKLGRLSIIRLGALIYIVGGFATVLSPSINWMFAFRFLAGIGAAAVFMTSIASVRDRYVGDTMARMMSFIFSIFLFTPILAPALGTLVLKYFSWQVVFLIPPSFGVLVFLWSFRINESLPKEARTNLKFSDVLVRLKTIISDLHFLRYVTVATLIFSVLSTYVSSSEYIIGEIYHKPMLFPYIFGGIGILMAIFSLGNSYFSRKWGARKALQYYLFIYFGFSALMVLVVNLWGDPPLMSVFFTLLAILMAITLAADPNSSAIALEYMGDNAGLAASVYGTIFFFVGSGVGTIISGMLVGTVLPFAVAAASISLLCALLVSFDKR